MDYIVWKQDPFSEAWSRFNCEGDQELQARVLELVKSEGEILVTVPVSFSVKVSIAKMSADVIPVKIEKPAAKKESKEKEAKSGAETGKPEDDQSPGDQSQSSV